MRPRWGRILALALIFAGVGWFVGRGCRRLSVPPKPPTPEELAFKPALLPVDERTVIAGRDIVVFRNVGDPVRAASLVTGKYARTLERASEETGVPRGLLEGVIYVESAGRSQVVSMAQAAGVIQMIPSTAQRFGLSVDEPKSLRLRARIRACLAEVERVKAKLEKGGTPRIQQRRRTILAKQSGMAKRLADELIRVDERFDPYKAIRAGARYLAWLYDRYGRWDFAVAAYHAGEGNIDQLVRLFIAGVYPDLGSPKKNVNEYELTYARIFFGCSPRKNPRTYEWLVTYKGPEKDYSAWYWWNVRAAEEAIKLYRHSPKAFRQKVGMWKSPTVRRRYELIPEVVWYPVGTPTFRDVGELKDQYAKGVLVKAPNEPKVFGFLLDEEEIGAHASSEVREWFFGSRPETIGLLMYLAYLTRETSGRWDEYLTVTSLVRSRAYQARLGSTAHSIHTMGWAVDISRKHYVSKAQRQGFQYALDVLRDRGDICYAKEGDYAIHIALNPRSAGMYRQVYEEGIAYLSSLDKDVGR